MDIDDIKDRESLEAWLKTRPREDAAAIAQRAALRVFPLFGRAMQEDWARGSSLTSSPFLRLVFVSGVACKYPTVEIRAAAFAAAADSTAANAAFSGAAAADNAAATSSANAAANAAFSALSAAAAAGANYAAPRSANAVAFSAATNSIAVWNGVRTDASVIIRTNDVLQLPLWPDTPPDWFTQADRETRAIWAENPEHWDFWTRWWDAAIAGTPLDWDLQRDIALIPDEVWQQGPGPVAVEIARLEELHNLRRELAELKQRIEQPEQVIEAIAGADLRGHNNPPELIETPAELRETLVVVWEELREAERELANPLPETGRLRRTGQAILSAAKSIAAYCLAVGNTVVKSAATVVGVALGGRIVEAILTNLPAIMAFAENLIAYGTRWLP